MLDALLAWFTALWADNKGAVGTLALGVFVFYLVLTVMNDAAGGGDDKKPKGKP